MFLILTNNCIIDVNLFAKKELVGREEHKRGEREKTREKRPESFIDKFETNKWAFFTSMTLKQKDKHEIR